MSDTIDVVITPSGPNITSVVQGGGVGPQGPQGATGPAGTSGSPGASVNLQVSDGYIQWQHVGDSFWTNLISISSLIGATGATGATGAAGANGQNGTNGESVNLQVSGGYIQWQHQGDSAWTNLISVSSLIGPTGATGATGPAGNDAEVTSANVIAALGYTPTSPSTLSSSISTAIAALSSIYTTTSAVASQIATYGYQTASEVTSAITSYGYQTASQVSSAISSALSEYATSASLSSAISALSSVYTTSSAVASQIATALSSYATQSWVTAQGYLTSISGQNLSQANNDAGFAYRTDNISEFTNDAGYVTTVFDPTSDPIFSNGLQFGEMAGALNSDGSASFANENATIDASGNFSTNGTLSNLSGGDGSGTLWYINPDGTAFFGAGAFEGASEDAYYGIHIGGGTGGFGEISGNTEYDSDGFNPHTTWSIECGTGSASFANGAATIDGSGNLSVNGIGSSAGSIGTYYANGDGFYISQIVFDALYASNTDSTNIPIIDSLGNIFNGYSGSLMLDRESNGYLNSLQIGGNSNDGGGSPNIELNSDGSAWFGTSDPSANGYGFSFNTNGDFFAGNSIAWGGGDCQGYLDPNGGITIQSGIGWYIYGTQQGTGHSISLDAGQITSDGSGNFNTSTLTAGHFDYINNLFAEGSLEVVSPNNAGTVFGVDSNGQAYFMAGNYQTNGSNAGNGGIYIDGGHSGYGSIRGVCGNAAPVPSAGAEVFYLDAGTGSASFSNGGVTIDSSGNLSANSLFSGGDLTAYGNLLCTNAFYMQEGIQFNNAGQGEAQFANGTVTIDYAGNLNATSLFAATTGSSGLTTDGTNLYWNGTQIA